ncbi:hypothetical protein [Burkholderia multivorans]|uniref:hypothetical protein n=1 Tax=Burkholderia multivorans TaxID=87883 RepID=UPI000D008B5D|nr:hypothetical protein [Burkholderia multivorans]PRE20311.1 hypothetical protein C6P78_03725 [Burkholderia multivorans]
MNATESFKTAATVAIPQYDEIDEILYHWYRWSNGFTEVRSYSGSDSTCRDFRISRQFMDHSDLNDLVDYQIRKTIGERVEPMIHKLAMKHRIAINVAMKNMEVGAKVWHNARYPDAREADYEEAKALLRPKFIAEGLVERGSRT